MLVDEDRGTMYPLLRFFRRSCIPQKISSSRPDNKFNESVIVSRNLEALHANGGSFHLHVINTTKAGRNHCPESFDSMSSCNKQKL